MSNEREAQHAAVEAAFELWPDAFGLAQVLLRDRDRAEELCQEAYLRLLNMKRKIDRDRPLRPLLLTTVRNLCLNELRRRSPSSLDAAGEGGHQPQGRPELEPFESNSREERRAAVRAALERLSPAWREMVYLRDGLGCSYREIAKVAATSEDVVRTTLHRARARLRELLARHAPEGAAGTDERPDARTGLGGTA